MRFVPRAILATTLAVAAALPLLMLAPAGTAEAAESSAGGIGIRLLPESTTGNDPRAGAYITDTIAPGTTLTRTVQLSNSTSTTQLVAVSTGTARITNNSFVVGAAGAANDLTSWTTIGTPRVELRAGGVQDVPVRITVPANTAPGERYGVIWAAISSTTGNGSQVLTVNRVGIRMYVEVTDQGYVPATFTIRHLTAHTSNGSTTITAHISNTGGRALDLTGRMHLSGEHGLAAGPYKSAHPVTIAPGKDGTVRVRTGAALPAGSWRASTTIRSGNLVHRASTRFAVAATSSPATPPTIAIIALVTVLAAALIATPIILTKRRRRRRAPMNG